MQEPREPEAFYSPLEGVMQMQLLGPTPRPQSTNARVRGRRPRREVFDLKSSWGVVSFALLFVFFVAVLLFATHLKFTDGGGRRKGGKQYVGHEERPNIVLLYLDDVGYGDLPAFGHPTTVTPNIDALLAESMVFTQAVSENSVCTPSRAALMTGRHAVRMGLSDDALRCLVNPTTPGGLLEGELTIADFLGVKKNYTSAFLGKWHLGINKNTSTDAHFMPTRRGFDYYWGMPVSHGPPCAPDSPNPLFCFLYENDKIVKQPPDMLEMEGEMTAKAMAFMDGAIAAEQPFFAVMAYQKMHTPLFPRAEYLNASRRGTFGAEMAELDANIGTLLRYLEDKNVGDNTIVILTSDNGPFLEEGVAGGSSGLFRGGKAQTWEGGFRVPLAWRWRGGNVAAGVRNHEFVTAMDILPTLADVLNFTLPNDRIYDGKTFGWALSQANVHKDTMRPTAQSPRQFAYFCGERLLAVRTGPYKTHFYTQRWLDETQQSCPAYGPIGACGCTDAMLVEQNPPLVFDIEVDPSERHPLPPLSDGDDGDDGDDGNLGDVGGLGDGSLPEYGYSQIVAAAALYRAQILDSLEDVENQLRLPLDDAIQPCCNPPLCKC